ncbi:MAG: CsbD family protein [Phycisphaerae bacterium]|nr:CsbD family protein [Gemmatimonadaceae bacterium]
MNWNQVEGYWMQLRGRMREQWGQMTNRHLDVVNGQRDQAVGLLQRRYGATESHRESGVPIFEAPSEVS